MPSRPCASSRPASSTHPDVTAVRVSELFHSLQGEGPSLGTPAHFLRLQGCPVGCSWCDTKYTWEESGGAARPLPEVFEALDALGQAPLLVVTGGEPLSHEGIGPLLQAALARWSRVEVETSGLEPPPVQDARLHYNWSPKLSSATSRASETWAHAASFMADPNTIVKVVVSHDADADEALERARAHAVPRERLSLMPEGLTDAQLQARGPWLAERCKRDGVRFSPRLHVWLWGARRGV